MEDVGAATSANLCPPTPQLLHAANSRSATVSITNPRVGRIAHARVRVASCAVPRIQLLHKVRMLDSGWSGFCKGSDSLGHCLPPPFYQVGHDQEARSVEPVVAVPLVLLVPYPKEPTKSAG
jgi:hypothetical protein